MQSLPCGEMIFAWYIRIWNMVMIYTRKTYGYMWSLPKWLQPLAKWLVGLLPFYLLFLGIMSYKMVKLAESFEAWTIYRIASVLAITQYVAIFLFFITPPAYLQKDEQIDTYLEANNLSRFTMKCRVCNMYTCLRSNHCMLCGDKCLAKCNEHSFWLNKCVDSRSLFIYWVYATISFFIPALSLILSLAVLYSKPSSIYSPFILYFVMVGLQTTRNFANFTTYSRLLFQNIMIFELDRWMYLPYCFRINKAENRKEPFNCFDRGICNNLGQALRSWVSCVSENKAKSKFSYSILPEHAIEMDLTGGDKTNTSGSSGEAKEEKGVSDPQNKPVQQYDGTFNPEWNTYRIYGLHDILNSPTRDMWLEEEKKEMEKMKARMEKMKQQQQLVLESQPVQGEVKKAEKDK